MTDARYYAVRRLNPYRGVEQVVEVANVSAHSLDGLTWHLRGDDGCGWVRPIGVWREGEGQVAGVARLPEELVAALRARPPLPFRLIDRDELWLLEHDSGMPLALLDSAPPSPEPLGVCELTWRPFVLPYAGFHSPSLARAQAGQRAPDRHRDVLERMVNDAARPQPAAQWFRRAAAGIGPGEGLEGCRLRPEWAGRSLLADAFPERLVRVPETAGPNNLLEQSVIREYHAHLASLLLLLPGLSAHTRAGLEIEAMARPATLARVHRLLPAMADPERIAAILVAARLESATGATEAQTDP